MRTLDSQAISRLNDLESRCQLLSRDSSVPIEAAGLLALCAQEIIDVVRDAEAPAIVAGVMAVQEMRAVKPRKARGPNKAKPAATEKTACPLGERHRYTDGVCKCGATKGHAARATVNGTTKDDPVTRPMPGTEVHHVAPGAAASDCGIPEGAILSAYRSEFVDAATCEPCQAA